MQCKGKKKEKKPKPEFTIKKIFMSFAKKKKLKKITL